MMSAFGHNVPSPPIGQMPKGAETARSKNEVACARPSIAATVRGRADVRTGPAAVADERVALTHQRDGRYSDQYRVRAFDEPAGTVTGCTDVQEGAPLVAEPRVVEQLAPGATGTVGGKWKDRPGYISVADWEKPARSITGKASVSGGCGVGAVANKRISYEGRTAENAHRFAGSPGTAASVKPAASP